MRENFFEHAESLLLNCTPIPLCVFFGEVIQRTSELSKVLNESTVKVGRAEEAAQFSEISRGRPICDDRPYFHLHPHFPFSDNQIEIFFYFGLVKLAFFWPEIEIVCS